MSLKSISEDYALKILMAGINVEDKESLKQGLQELIGGSSSEGVDWNENDEASPAFIKNRPFYSTYEPVEGITIEWDGNKEGHVLSEPNGHYIKVSDMVLTDEQLSRMFYTDSDGNVNSFFMGMCSEDISPSGDGGPAIVRKVGVSVPGGSPDTFPETGVYFQSSQRSLYSEAYAAETVYNLDKKYLPSEINESLNKITELQGSLANKMDKMSPSGSGAFSLNRKSGSKVGIKSFTEGNETLAAGDYSHAEGFYTEAFGNCSHAEGDRTEANADYSHAEGSSTTAYGGYSHAEGNNTNASGESSHAEGKGTVASGNYSHAEGQNTKASEGYSHAEGQSTTASGYGSHAEGQSTTASGLNSHAEGLDTTASGAWQHVQGKYNIEDTNDKYAHIVGNGNDSNHSNAHTLDWDGNAWFAGTVEGTAIILPSTTESSTKKFRITVDDSGTISATEITG